MVRVSTIWDEVKKIVGNSNDAFLYRRITDAIELLANKGDFDPYLGYLDICVRSQVVTLPPEVETIIGLNMCGRPALARDQFFRFHLNGPGDLHHRVHSRLSWMDLGDACTYREIECPAKLIAFCELPEDESTELWVEGYDEKGNIIRTKEGDTWLNGYRVPVFSGTQDLPDGAPMFSRITRVRLSEHAGPIRLSSIDGSSSTGTLLGIYQWNEVEPRYRRIKISECVSLISIGFRKSSYEIKSKNDLIPLHNAQAIIMAVRALKKYDEPGGMAEAEMCEATATRWLTEEQYTRNPQVAHPIQVLDENPISDPRDYVD